MTGGPLHALIIEDVETDAELLIMALERGGYRVAFTRVQTAPEMRAAMMSESWDIIFSDHAMPRFSSLEALKIYQEFQSDIPFIIISGTIGEEVAVDAMRHGANDYFIKGNLARLIPAVERELREFTRRQEKRQIEQMLHENEARYSLVVEGSNDGVWDWDRQTRQIYHSDRVYQMIGVTPGTMESTYEAFLQLLHPEDLERFEMELSHAIQTRSQFSSEFRLKHGSGAYHYYFSRGRAYYNEDGVPVRVSGLISDITERKQGEEALQQSFQREQLIRRITEMVSRTHDLDLILNAAAEAIGQFFQADRCIINRYIPVHHNVRMEIRGQYCRSPEIIRVHSSEPQTTMITNLTQNIPIEELTACQFTYDMEAYLAMSRARIQEMPHLSETQKNRYIEGLRHLMVDEYGIRAFIRVGIHYRGISYGTLSLHQCIDSREWKEHEIELLRDLGTQIGVAVYQADLYEQERQTAIREGLIRRIIQSVHSAIRLDDKVQEIATQLGEALNTDHVFIARYEPKTHRLTPPSREYRSSGDIPSLLQSERFSTVFQELGWFLDQLCETGEPIQFDQHTAGLLPSTMDYLTAQRICSGLALGITYGEECLAILFIHQVRTPRQWSDAEIEMIQTIARQSGIAIFQSELYRNELDAKENFHKLYDWEKKTRRVIQELGQTLNTQQLMYKLADNMGGILNADACYILQFDQQKPCPVEIEFLRHSSLPSLRGNVAPWHTCGLYEKLIYGQPVFIADTQALDGELNPDWRIWLKEGQVGSLAMVPILSGQEVISALILHTRSPRHWEENEIVFLRIIGEQATNSILQSLAKESIEKANQRKSEFLAVMSHELRTPLNAVIGYSDMLLQGLGNTPEKLERYAHNISISGHHLLDMVNDILDVSKVEAGQLNLFPTIIELPNLISEIKGIFQDLAFRKNIQLSFVLAPDLAGVIADPVRLKQICLNLINNAIKFNLEGGQVEVRMRTSPDGQWFICDVEDSGIGIPKNKLMELFQPFSQIDTSYSRQQEGTGLGLALTKRLVELHGGTITVDSIEGVRSIFTFTLPTHGPSGLEVTEISLQSV